MNRYHQAMFAVVVATLSCVTVVSTQSKSSANIFSPLFPNMATSNSNALKNALKIYNPCNHPVKVAVMGYNYVNTPPRPSDGSVHFESLYLVPARATVTRNTAGSFIPNPEKEVLISARTTDGSNIHWGGVPTDNITNSLPNALRDENGKKYLYSDIRYKYRLDKRNVLTLNCQ